MTTPIKTPEQFHNACADVMDALARPSEGMARDQGATPLVGTGSWLGRVLRAGYEPGDGTTEGEQMIDGEWWRPKVGCDSLAEVFEAIEAEARPNGSDQPPARG